jgi:hypothetical protein
MGAPSFSPYPADAGPNGATSGRYAVTVGYKRVSEGIRNRSATGTMQWSRKVANHLRMILL